MPSSPDELDAWYRQSLREKLAELEPMLVALGAGDDAAAAAIRAIAHKLRGSAASFGFAEVGDAGAAAEIADDADLAQACAALVQVMRAAAGRE